MSILSQLFAGKVTFDEAVTEGNTWFSTLLAKAPPAVQAAAAAGLSDFKQAASDAVTLADTALGPILNVGTLAVEVAATTAMTATIGAAGSAALSPGIDAAITQVSNALHAEIDAVAAQVRAKIVGGTTS